MDILSDELAHARAEGALFSVLQCLPPWGLGFSGTRPLTVHIILEGSAWIERAGEDPVEIRAGDVVLATAGPAYALVSEQGASVVPIEEARQRPSSPVQDPERAAVVMCGAYTLNGSVGESLLRGLPPFALVRADDQEPSQRMAVGLLVAEVDRAAEGQRALLDRLLDVNLVFTLRAWWQVSDSAPGWYSALRLPTLRRVLEGLYADPSHPWTLESMAQRAGISRAALAAQFRAVVGTPPVRFLTQLRMTRAEDALIRTDSTLAAIAAEVGYSNEYAFSTAFRRNRGCSPGRWRQERRGTAGREV